MEFSVTLHVDYYDLLNLGLGLGLGLDCKAKASKRVTLC